MIYIQMSEVSKSPDRILVNSHTGRNECSESLAEADLAYFVPNMDSVAVSTITYILSIMIDDFRTLVLRSLRKDPRTRVDDKFITALVMFHPSTRPNTRN